MALPNPKLFNSPNATPLIPTFFIKLSFERYCGETENEFGSRSLSDLIFAKN